MRLDWSWESQVARDDTLFPLLPSTGGHRIRLGVAAGITESIRLSMGCELSIAESLRAGTHEWAPDYSGARLRSTQHAAWIAGSFDF